MTQETPLQDRTFSTHHHNVSMVAGSVSGVTAKRKLHGLSLETGETFGCLSFIDFLIILSAPGLLFALFGKTGQEP